MATDPKYLRLNDVHDPNRREKFNRTCDQTGIDGNATLRKLVDALHLYVTEHGHPPVWPVRLVPIDDAKPKRKRRAK